MGTKTDRETTDAVEILHRRYVDGDPEAAAMLEGVRSEAEVARDIYRIRTEAGLTQQELSRRIGTTASVISRLEDADYAGHSLAMLRRIAAALGRRVEIRFPAIRKAASASQGRPVTARRPSTRVAGPGISRPREPLPPARGETNGVADPTGVKPPKPKRVGRRPSPKTGRSSE